MNADEVQRIAVCSARKARMRGGRAISLWKFGHDHLVSRFNSINVVSSVLLLPLPTGEDMRMITMS
jgi:hypothetical protein